MLMIKIKKRKAISNKKKSRKRNYFNYNVTKDGIYFCSINSLSTHPSLIKKPKFINVEQSDILEPEINE